MASLNSLINAKYKEPSATVKLGGSAVPVISIEYGNQIDSGIAQCTITTAQNISTTPETKVVISQGYDGKEQRVFTGYVDTIEKSNDTLISTLTVRDVLKKAMDTYLIQEIKFGLDINTGYYYYSTYTGNNGGEFTVHQYSDLASLNAAHPETTGNYTNEGVKAEAVVQWMLVMCGFSEESEIRVDDTEFFIGDLSPASFQMTSVYDAIQQICDLIGWRLYADAAGVVRFKQKPRNASGYSTWSYDDKESGKNNIYRVTKTQTNLDLRNYVEVRGASGIVTVVRGESPYIGSVPYRGVLLSDELIDTQDMADFVANRVYADLNRLKVTLTLEVDGNPILTPASSISVNSQVATGTFLVEQISTTMSVNDGYKMTIDAVQYPADSEAEEPEPDIIADFTITDVISIGDPTYLIQFDGSPSYSSRGTIANYTWGFPDGTTQSSSEPYAWTKIPMEDLAAGVTINLTVTDSTGATATTASGIDLAWINERERVQYRHLYGALTNRAVGSLDTGITWNVQNINAISVAASNFGPNGEYVSSGYAIFGTLGGGIYRTIDGNITITQVTTVDGDPITVHVPELDSDFALVGTSTGKLYKSIDGGQSFQLTYTFPSAVLDARFAYTDTSYVLVVASGMNAVYESFDGGITFLQQTYGIAATKESSGSSTNYFAHTAGVVSISGGSPVSIPFEGGSSPFIPAITVMIDRDDGVMSVDSDGQHWVLSSGEFRPTQNNSANLTRHMLRDGAIPIITYYATQSGISKSLDRNETIQELYYPTDTMPEGGYGKMVAYGPLTTPVIAGRVVVLTRNVINEVVLVSGLTSAGANTLLYASDAGWVPVSRPDYGFFASLSEDGQYYSLFAVTPGYMAYATTSNDNVYGDESIPIGLLALTSSGLPTVVDHWAETPNGYIKNMCWSSQTYGKLYITYSISDDEANSYNFYWSHYTNFHLTMSGVVDDDIILENVSRAVNRNIDVSALSPKTETMAYRAAGRTLGTLGKQGFVNLINKTVSVYDFDTINPPWNAPYWSPLSWGAKFNSENYALVKFFDPLSGKYGTTEKLTAPQATWPQVQIPEDSWNPEGVSSMPGIANTYSSWQYAGSMYVGIGEFPSGDTRLRKIVRLNNYGSQYADNSTTDSSIVVFTAAEGWRIANYSVTPSPDYLTDCIAVATIADEVSDSVYIYYSTDGGVTWTTLSPLRYNNYPLPTVNVSGVWYIAEPPSE